MSTTSMEDISRVDYNQKIDIIFSRKTIYILILTENQDFSLVRKSET